MATIFHNAIQKITHISPQYPIFWLFKLKSLRFRRTKGPALRPMCLVENTLFYSISFHFIYFIYVGSILRTAGCISQFNKREGQITYHSHSNSKQLKLQKTVARWMQEMPTVAYRSVVWFCKATRESLCWTFGNDRHLGEGRRSKIYKMWALLLIIVPGKRG